MKYTGPRAEAFEREARALLAGTPADDHLDGGLFSAGVLSTDDVIRQDAFDAKVSELAKRYGIGAAEIWDILPEYEAVA